MSDETIPHQRSYDVNVIASMDLTRLHELVARTKTRFEITRPGTDERCVLLSAAELDALERAIEILSDTAAVRDIRGQIAQLAAATGPAHAIAAV